MIRTILMAIGAIVVAGGFLMLFALMVYRAECRAARKERKDGE